MEKIVIFLQIIFFSSCTWNEIIPEQVLPDEVFICVPDTQVFADLVQPIIDANCVACHSKSSGRPAMLENYEGIIHALNNHSLNELVTLRQMPMYGSTPLLDVEIDIINDWANCE
tara:strand:+ start:420 stop:764 length:345 start_codon:yes stop_codon:yes gene_type:complete